MVNREGFNIEDIEIRFHFDPGISNHKQKHFINIEEGAIAINPRGKNYQLKTTCNYLIQKNKEKEIFFEYS